ncbi:hypothetical protein BBJ28_00022097 [Nothophytophthora sp. Chile5]|nr:hypothetical protein BBJ28_00022097 [Nothophytophthora sp. Chile5]
MVSLKCLSVATGALLLVASSAEAVVPNWVGSSTPSDSACYRKTYLTSECPTGYTYDNLATCWAQCPLAYPVECAMECIPQSADCTLEILTKIESVATVAIWAATSGVFGELSAASEGVQLAVQCTVSLYTLVEAITDYAKTLQSDFPTSTEEQLLSLLENSDIVIYDLPVAVATCLGLSTPSGLDTAAEIVAKVTTILEEVVSGVTSSTSGTTSDTTSSSSITSVFSSFDSFLTFVEEELGLSDIVSALSTDDVSTATTLIESDTSCGQSLETLINKIVAYIQEIKTADVSTATDVIRLAISTSELVLTEIPEVTNDCVSTYDNLTEAYETRDAIRAFFETVVDQLVSGTSSSDGTALSTVDYALKVTDYALGIIAMFDPSGIAAMVAEFLEPICGPTEFIGEVDDGSLADALGLTADGDAFTGSYGTWNLTGDGVMSITFVSSDTDDVTVNVHSGGVKVASVAVASGTTVTWTSTVAAFEDKTLYLDRWRPGLLGIPGTGGGSLLLWVSRSSAGGHLDLQAKINVS